MPSTLCQLWNNLTLGYSASQHLQQWWSTMAAHYQTQLQEELQFIRSMEERGHQPPKFVYDSFQRLVRDAAAALPQIRDFCSGEVVGSLEETLHSVMNERKEYCQ